MKKIFAMLFVVVVGSMEIVSAQVSVNKNEIVKGIPAGYSLAYFVKDTLMIPTYYVIFEPNNDENYYSDFKLFSGHQLEIFREKKILEPVTRYKDGGTTVISSVMGVFYFPTPLHSELHPTLTISGKENLLMEIK